MTPDKRDRINTLCAQIAIEKDQSKFSELIKELNDLLEGGECTPAVSKLKLMFTGQERS